jgi:hypothetical protein
MTAHEGFRLFKGELVRIELTAQSGVDAFNAPVFETTLLEVADVLVSPGATRDIEQSNRPDGARLAYTLHFPKAFTEAFEEKLDGLWIQVRGERLRVVGSPRAYAPELTPGAWNMPVEVEAVNG